MLGIITAVVVTYNRKAMLINCIKGLLRQDRIDHIIIIDNASTDGTQEHLHANNLLDTSI